MLCFSGYDGVPIESLQGLDLNSGNDNIYNPDPIIVNTPILLHKDLPEPPIDTNNPVAAWYDTDL